MTGVAQLVVSELVTNARKYAPGPCGVNIEWAGAVLEITVWDTDPALPVVRAADPGRVGGHGLEIVTALCEGFEVRREPFGKRVTARVLAEPAVGQAPCPAHRSSGTGPAGSDGRVSPEFSAGVGAGQGDKFWSCEGCGGASKRVVASGVVRADRRDRPPA